MAQDEAPVFQAWITGAELRNSGNFAISARREIAQRGAACQPRAASIASRIRAMARGRPTKTDSPIRK
jgi:hypothetical protein